MIEGWTVIALALGYVSGLFALAWYADRNFRSRKGSGGRPVVYALSLAVYCTSWTFFGSVGFSATTGYDFFAVYLGPVLLFVFGWRFLLRIVRVAKSQNITSVADFLAARYGKSQAVGAIVTIIAVAGTLPYIALQLKAVALSVTTLLGAPQLQAVRSADRHGFDRRAHHGGFRRPLRHPPHRRDRAPGRPDCGRRCRVARQAGGLPDGRLLRDLLRLRRHRRVHRAHRQERRDPTRLRLGRRRRLLAHRHLPQHGVHRAAAAAVPRHGGGEQLRQRGAPGRLAVSRLSAAHQPVRGADRRSRPDDAARRAPSPPTCTCSACRSPPAPTP